MTTTAPHRVGRPRGAVCRAVVALVALVAITVGPPVALVLAVGNPVPEQLTIAGSLSDDAIIGLLAGVVWAAWIQLVLVIALEAIAAVRGGALPRLLPGCGFQQHLARRLVVAASLLLAGTASLPISMAPASATVATAPVSHTFEDRPTATANVVESAPSLAPVRSAEPSALSSQPMGTKAQNDGELWYEVSPPQGRHHDSLWDIAERHLGDGLRWREIYDLNRHREQADGQRLEQPRLIHPGWRLLMPDDAIGLTAAKPERTKPAEAVVSEEAPPSVKEPAEVPTGQVRPPLPHPRPAGAVGTATPVADSPTVTPPVAPPVAAPSPKATNTQVTTVPGVGGAVQADAADHEPTVDFAGLTLGLCAVSAAGLLAELARRRRRAQRLRQPGERLTRPTEPGASAERRLRTANAELTVTSLRDSLRDLAAACRAAGRPLPDVELVTLNDEQATLHLRIDDADALYPFVARNPRTWFLEHHSAGSTAGAEDVDEAVDPYPALVALGVTADAVVLVNLEAAGSLSILGDPEQTSSILHALIAELGTSVLASTTQIALAGCPLQLAQMLDHGRVTVLEPGQAPRWATARMDGVATVLAAAGVSTVHAARGNGQADDLWSPAVLVCGPGVSADVASEPHRGLSVVALNGDSGSVDGWTLSRADETWRLEPHGIELVPQQLDVATLDAVGELLATAEMPPETSTIGALEPQAAPTAALSADDWIVRSCAPADEAPVGGAIPADAEVSPDPDRGTPARDQTPRQNMGAPRVLVLGPVEVVGASDDLAPGRRGRATELVAYLTLHPGATQHQLDEALWPGCRVSRNTRNPLVSRTRQWLGTNADGQPFLGLIAAEGAYVISPEVRSDWHEFRYLAERGMAAEKVDADDLIAALQLVRGRPFLGVNPAGYGWAEADAQDMISAIVDTAHALAEVALALGDARRARWAAAKGLSAEPFAELLFQDAIRAATAAGDRGEVQRLARLLRRRLTEFEPDDDVADETAELIVTARGD